MAVVFDSVRRQTIPRALEVRLVLGRAAETLALWQKGVVPDEPQSLQEAAELLEIAAPDSPGEGSSVAERNDRAEIQAALQGGEARVSQEALEDLRSLARDLRAACDASTSLDPDGLVQLLHRVLDLRHAAAAARAVPPDEGANQGLR